MKTTVFVTHPNINQSRVNSALAKGAASLTDLEVRYLYDLYPDGKIDVAAEQAALEKDGSYRAAVSYAVVQHAATP